jgi:NADH-quinone oxidoreductase subunit L
MRKMGGLARYMPWTAVTCWIGALALIGTPFFAGFYSKDAIIEAVHASHRWGATYAYWCVLSGVFVTALYTFRMIFMTFHGPERFHAALAHAHDEHAHEEHAETHAEAGDHAHAHGAHEADGEGAHGDAVPHESPWVVVGPLVALAVPSVLIGALTVGPVLFGNYFGNSIVVLEHNNVVAEIGREVAQPSWLHFALHGFLSAPFWLALAGVLTAWACFLRRPELADRAASAFAPLRTLLVNKYYFDWINENVIAPAGRLIGFGLWRGGDQAVIDGVLVDGTAENVGRFGGVLRLIQSGYLYSYAFWMIIGLAVLLGWFLIRSHAV